MCTVPPTVLQKFLSALSSLAFVWCFHFLFFICCTTGICHNMAILSPVSVHLTWPMRLVLVHTPKPVINVVPIVSVHWFMNKTYTVCGTDFSNGSRCLCSKYTKSVQFFFFFFLFELKSQILPSSLQKKLWVDDKCFRFGRKWSALVGMIQNLLKVMRASNLESALSEGETAIHLFQREKLYIYSFLPNLLVCQTRAIQCSACKHPTLFTTFPHCLNIWNQKTFLFCGMKGWSTLIYKSVTWFRKNIGCYHFFFLHSLDSISKIYPA